MGTNPFGWGYFGEYYAGITATTTWSTSPIESKEFSSAASGTTYTFTSFGADIPAGTLIGIGWSANVGSLTATCSDNSSQAGTANSYNVRTPIPASAITGGIVWCYTTRKILTTDTITVTVSGAATRRDGRLVTFTIPTIPTLDQAANQPNRTTSPVTMGPTAALSTVFELGLAFSFWKGAAVPSGVADSTSGYTLIVASGSGGTVTNMETNLSYNPNLGSAATTDTHTFTSMTAACGEIIVFAPTGGSVPGSGHGNLLLLGVGT